MSGEPVHVPVLEEVGVLPDEERLTLAVVDSDDVEVRLGGAIGDRLHHPRLEAAPAPRAGRGVVEGEERLDKWRAVWPARGRQRFDHPLKRHVGVRDRVEDRSADALQKRAHGGVPGKVDAQCRGPNRHPDQALGGKVGAVGEAAPDLHLVAPPAAPEQHREGGQGDLERGRVLGPAELADRRRQPRRDAAPHRAAHEGLAGRPPPRRRHLQQRWIGVERAAPEVELAAPGLAVRQRALPAGVVDELYRHLVEIRPAVFNPSRVELGQLGEEDREGPAVVHGMVLDVDQGPAPRPAPDQRPAHQRRPVERDPGAHPLANEARPLTPAVLALDDLERYRRRVVDDLDDLSAALLDRGPVRLVALHQVAEGSPQGVLVELSLEVHQSGELERERVRVHPLEQPGAALGEGGGGRPVRARRPGQRRPGIGGSGLEAPGQRPRGGGVEDRPHLDVDPEAVAQPPDQLDRQQRVGPEGEEVLVGAERVELQQVAHQLRDRTRSPVSRVVPVRSGGSGKRGAVDLAALGQRQHRQQFDRRRQHERGQAFRQVSAQGRLVGSGGIAQGGVGDQPLVAGDVLAGDDRGLTHVRVGAKRLLHLARLDPVTGDLHLVVGPPEELELAVVAPAHQVARAVHARPGTAHERVRPEAVGTALGVAAVAACHGRAADPQLTHLARGDRSAFLVEDVEIEPGQRLADRQRRAVDFGHLEAGCDDRRLGRPVAVDDADAGVRAEHGAGGGRGHHVARGGDQAHPAEVRQRRAHDLLEEAGGEEGEGDTASSDQPAHRSRVRAAGWRQDQPGPDREGAPDLERRDVELERRHPEHRVALPRHQVGAAAQHVQEVRMGDLDPLRAPGRARGEEHVGEPLAARGHGAIGSRIVQERRDVEHLRRRRQPRCLAGLGQHPSRAGELEQLALSPGRVGGADRHVGGAGAHRTDESADGAPGARQADADRLLGPHARCPQRGRDGSAGGVQLSVGEAAPSLLDCDRVRCGGGPLDHGSGDRGLRPYALSGLGTMARSGRIQDPGDGNRGRVPAPWGR
jgi:hypothetical protein